MRGFLRNINGLIRSSRIRRFTTLDKIHKNPPDYKQVPFLKEDLDSVLSEVPEFNFYYFGSNTDEDYPYKDVPMTEPIYVRGSEGKFTPVDNKFQYAKLENGLRIATLDKGGLDTHLALYVNAGSAHEDEHNQGVASMIENMAFHSTAHLSHLRTIKTVETLGANVSCNAFREHTVYQAEFLRQDLPFLVNLLVGNVLFPRFLTWELAANKHRLADKRKRVLENADQLVTEHLHSVAWHNNTLGNFNYCLEQSEPNYTPELMRDFMLKHFYPKNCVLVAVNSGLDELSKWAMRAFSEYNAIPNPSGDVGKLEPKYTGGVRYVDGDTPFTHVAVAYPVKGWDSKQVIVTTLLQSILGGGGSFSTGGPGKGLTTSLYNNVLNRYEFVESCMAFNTVHSTSGLFGIYLVVNGAYASGNMDQVFTLVRDEFERMKKITNHELSGGKNSLKSFLHMSLEHKAVVCEDVGRQLLFCNRVLDPSDLENLIDEVTLDDIKAVVNELRVNQTPSVVVYGKLSRVPHPDTLLQLLH
ncbi:Insulinase (Peptidase family M16) family protein [Theileria parva strain Muguga]|uniref:Ubiquinol-cytochrome C reductase complex core protein II, mitochondrial, putative n=1 Tax=Theileria parva TaxID=5875 RepID=Q4N5S2_THEPA|nr:Insulinase (Peptidase family M16) family protein [Theileria parva strain Muguga]EAN32501.1 Insulinase (Peptidase family M16) family protein [Theileria parva strain Muguga]|eukprot:XP_764784.1 ubiquinol-cytochrome C reductase complex core protein II, mitochondrial precursor [Theileria parva strain Muguga]